MPLEYPECNWFLVSLRMLISRSIEVRMNLPLAVHHSHSTFQSVSASPLCASIHLLFDVPFRWDKRNIVDMSVYNYRTLGMNYWLNIISKNLVFSISSSIFYLKKIYYEKLHILCFVINIIWYFQFFIEINLLFLLIQFNSFPFSVGHKIKKNKNPNINMIFSSFSKLC